VLAYGVERFAKEAHEAGAAAWLLTDLPAGADPAVETAVTNSSLALIRLVAPTTDDARLKSALTGASGFVYLISRLGVTGNPGRCPGRSRRAGAPYPGCRPVGLPVAVGFGIGTPPQAAARRVRRTASWSGSALNGRARQGRGRRAGRGSPTTGRGGARMRTSRFVGPYSQSSRGSERHCSSHCGRRSPLVGQIPEIFVLFGSAVALRGLSVPLSKYSYLTQTVSSTDRQSAGRRAGNALAVAGATIVTDWLWQRKPLRVRGSIWVAKSSRWLPPTACTRQHCTGSTCRMALRLEHSSAAGPRGLRARVLRVWPHAVHLSLIIRAKLEPANG